jgi:DNA polymerase (family 10)
MLVRELIRIFKDEWLPVDSLLGLDKKSEVTRALLESTGDQQLVLAWDSMPLWKVRGLGPKKAMDLWQQGVRPGNLRRHLKLLPDATRIALQYPVMERIPRKLVEQTFAMFVPSGEKTKCVIVGSYRRGKPTSGDVDILYSGTDFDKFMTKVQDHLGSRWQLMAKGPSKVAGIFLITPNAAVEIDIWISTPENRAYMLLYSTGSKQHNVKMRFIAKHRGYKLNQYCLEDLKTGKKFPAKTEKDIFDLLKMRYKPPAERD